MRTTLTIDDSILKKLKELSHASGVSFKQVVNQTLEIGLGNQIKKSQRKTFHQKTFSMGFSQSVEMDKSLQVAEILEDEEFIRKMESSR